MSRRAWLAPVAVVGLFVAVACGDVNADLSPESAVGVAAAPDASTMVLSQGLSNPCPEAPPVPRYLADGGVVPDLEFVADGGSELVPDVCNTNTGTCEYGASADRHCNRAFTCQNNEWAESPSAGCHAGTCPGPGTLIADIEGRPCTLDADAGATGPEAEAVCNVVGGVCACTTGSKGEQHTRRWVCSAPLIRSCPLERPLIGSRCSGSTYCDFGACRAKRGMAMACLDDRWHVVPPTCAD